jgi:hypothetical protein
MTKTLKFNPMEAVTNHDFAVAVTRFPNGHEIAIPKRMDPEEAARYAATNDLF